MEAKEKLALGWMAAHLNQKGINSVLSKLGPKRTAGKPGKKQESEALQNIRKVFAVMGGKQKG